MEQNHVFTDFTYDNLGVPRNPDNPFYSLPKAFNPLRSAYIDLGLGGSGRTGVDAEAEKGKMKVPTLRNIGKTAPYTHNGYFTNLEDLVHFYNTRDVSQRDGPHLKLPRTLIPMNWATSGLTIPKKKQLLPSW